MASEAQVDTKVDLAPAEAMIARYQDRREAVIALLQDVQEHYGYLPREVLDLISQRLALPRTQLYSLATFYRAFSLVPQGKHKLCVCTGTACHVRGAVAVIERIQAELGIEPGQTTADRLFSPHTVNCVGACALGPVVTVDGEYHGHMTGAKVRKMLRRYGFKKEDEGNASESR